MAFVSAKMHSVRLCRRRIEKSTKLAFFAESRHATDLQSYIHLHRQDGESKRKKHFPYFLHLKRTLERSALVPPSFRNDSSMRACASAQSGKSPRLAFIAPQTLLSLSLHAHVLQHKCVLKRAEQYDCTCSKTPLCNQP